jgi:hypothetical protein
MYRLISSDMDGTILLDGAQFVDERTLSNVEKLVDMGIVFAPASGRQYPNLRMRFERVADKLAYISENGALVVYRNEVLYKQPMDREIGLAIMEEIYETPFCEVLVSGEQISYLRPKDEAYLHRIRDLVKNKVVVVDRFEDIREDFLKISACDLSGICNSQEKLRRKFEGKVSMAVSGKLYLDYTATGVNKGHAVEEIQKCLGIKKSESASFGDNYNDLEMFHATGTAYCMKTAVPEVQQHADVIIENVNDILEKIIKE